MILSELEKKLNRISKVFDVSKIINLRVDKEHVRDYYDINYLPYSLFHDRHDFVHMGLSRDGSFHKDDLLQQAKLVDRYITDETANVLELASGRGVTAAHLATNHRSINFYGVDIAQKHLNRAKKLARSMPNLEFFEADFHNLKIFESSYFQIVFIIEALCYSRSPGVVLDEVYRVMKKGGYFVIFDGYRVKEDFGKEESTAIQLTEKGMAVERFGIYKDLLRTAKKSRFRVVRTEDFSERIVPTLERFEKRAAVFFHRPRLARIVKKPLPELFLYNAISGYLLVTLIKENIVSYKMTVLRK